MFLFPVSFDDSPTEQCILDREVSESQFDNQRDYFNSRGSQVHYTLRRDNNRDVPKSKQDGVLRLNYSKFVTATPLKSFVKTPRPCAYESL